MRSIQIAVPVATVPNQPPETVVFDTQVDLFIENDVMLSDHMKRLPATAAYWNKVLADYKRDLSFFEEDFKVWMAGKKAGIEAGKFKSETAKEEHIIATCNEEYLKKRKVILDLEYYVSLIKDAICNPLIVKKDMLVSICALQRQEMAMGINLQGKAETINHVLDRGS